MSPLWFGIDLSSRKDIASKFDHVSLRSWGLSNHTLNALFHYNFKMTAGDVIRADENFAAIRGLGIAGLDELEDKITQLLTTVQIETDAPFSASESRSTIVTNSKAAVTSLPEVLPESVQKLPLDQLHLDTKTHHALIEAKITTIGDLYNASNSSIRDIRGFHPYSLVKVNDSLITLLNSISQEMEADWFQYWKDQGIQILLPAYTSDHPSEQIIRELPTIIEEVLRRELDERAGIIIKRRFGLGNVEKLTLEDIGNAFGGISRERIRQLEEKALRTLQDVFIEQHYAGKDYHVHPIVHLMIQTIRDTVEAESSKLILETKLFEHVCQTFNIDSEKVKWSLYLILSLIGIQRIAFDYPNAVPVWGYVESVQLRILDSGIKRLDDLLTRETSLPYTEFDILVHLNKKAKRPEKLTSAQLSWLISLCNSVERREDDSMWGKFEYLKGRGNQVERILFESGRPMSVAEIAREINHRLVPLRHRQLIETNLSNQLGGDDRLVPIGRSGKWGLKSWEHVDTKSILALMEQYLITRNESATVDEIYTYVSERRPVSKSSILMYLGTERKTFIRMGRTTWGLAGWTNSTETNTWNKEQVADFVANFFRKNKSKEVDYKILKQALMDEANINAYQAQGLLNHSPALKTRIGTQGGVRRAFLQPNYKDVLAQAKTYESMRGKFRQQIEKSVRSILEAAPDNEMPMVELMRQLHRLHDCPDSTLYKYISQMKFVERVGENSRTKICRLVDTYEEADSRNLRHRISESVRSILEKAPGKEVMLGELIVRVQKECKCPKATVYQYASHLDFVERMDAPNGRGKLCRLKGDSQSQRPQFPIWVQQINNPPLREKVEWALPLLTEDFVDLGLFLLSKEFEATLKSYLTAAHTKGKLSITPGGKSPDRLSLAEMISCIRSNGIVTDDAVLSYLRQSRNDRAHGTMPSLAERKVFMNNVQHIAGLYIDYIKLFDDLTQNL